MKFVEEKEKELQGKIIPQTKKADFEEFWAKNVKELRDKPLKINRKKLDTPWDKTITSYEISFSTHDKTEVKAWFSHPADAKGKLPCVVFFHGGGGKGNISTEIVSCGVCCFAIDVRSQGGTYDKAEYKMGNDYFRGIMTHDVLYKDSFYMKNIYLDAVRAVDVVSELPEVDSKKIVTYGISQGGALAIAASALGGKAIKSYSAVPSYGCLKERVLKGSGVFDAVNSYLSLHPDDTDTVFDTLSYFDTNNMVSLLKAPASFMLGLTDPICLPEFVYSFYHHTQVEKELMISPFTPHVPSKEYLYKIYNEFADLQEG